MVNRKALLYVTLSLSLLAAVMIGGAAVWVTTNPGSATAVQATNDDFPGAAMRTAKTPPTFELTNQEGEVVTLEKLRGKVVIVTAVFATCHTACPTILASVKRAVNKLSPADQEKLAIVAITLDPENDTELKRKAAAQTHGLAAPMFNYVNGEDPKAVLKLIEDYGYARSVNEETGEIGHTNMFVLIDKDGKIAYNVMLDREDRDWLGAALADLLDD